MVDPLVKESESEEASMSEAGESEAGLGEVGLVWNITNDIKRWLMNQFKSKKISAISYDEIAGKISRVRQVVSDMDRKYVRLEGRLEERERVESIIERKMSEVKGAPLGTIHVMRWRRLLRWLLSPG